MTLASNTTPVPSPPNPGWPPSTPGLRALRAAGVMTCPVSAPLIPAPIKRLSGHAKLNDEVSREALRFDLTPFFPPQPHQGVFIVAHDNLGIRQQRTAAP